MAKKPVYQVPSHHAGRMIHALRGATTLALAKQTDGKHAEQTRRELESFGILNMTTDDFEQLVRDNPRKIARVMKRYLRGLVL